MSAGQYNFLVEQGATFSRVIDWQDSAGVGINLTNYTIAAKIKKRVSDANAILSLSVSIANQTTNPGRFTISLTATQTGTLPFKQTENGLKDILEVPYDIEATTGSTVYRILEGTFQISPQVT